MGKVSWRKAGADQFDGSDADSVSSDSTTFSEPTMANETEHVNSIDFQLEKYIDALYEKRGSVRETALLGLAEAFEGQVLLPFTENKCITLLHQYLASIKKGSSKEACLASRTIGLLAITVGAGNKAHEIMEESIYPLSQALVSGSDKTKKKAVIDCLALVTFIGANDLIETEGSLKIIWQVIYPKSGPNVGSVKKPDSAVLSSAISAWSFLLTTISSWRINPDSWKESISFLYNLLEDPDRSVRIAAGEALGLFFELGILDMNFQREDTNIDKLEREISKHGAFHHLQGLKAKILARACDLSTEAGGKGTDKKNLNDQRELFQKFLDFVETGDCPETLLKISRKQRFLTTSTWAQMLQLNFLKGFLGKGFLKHAQDNELLHDVFDFAQDRMGMLSTRKKISKSDDKGWTQKMNKDRKLAQVRKQGHLIPEDD
ncbi:interferon-related developmental regulator 2-like [Zingiber officinale]|uniref:interferon-related developmental regulator 2-like n=1 Tax=Zingiber officinale TaxID=94328 RepID=UPI001C4C9DEE|nr:interferon-related developmental regulator 2-like [Zingiber officinale]